MQYGDGPCCRAKCPATTADTTAGLGCGRRRLPPPRVSFDPPGCGSGMRCSCAAGTMLSPWRTGREIATLPDSFPAVPSQRLSKSLINSIDKSFSHRHSCRAVAGKHHGDHRRKKTRKEAALSAHSQTFRVFQNSRLFNSHRLFGVKILCVTQMGIVVPVSTAIMPKKLGSQLSKSLWRENHL